MNRKSWTSSMKIWSNYNNHLLTVFKMWNDFLGIKSLNKKIKIQGQNSVELDKENVKLNMNKILYSKTVSANSSI